MSVLHKVFYSMVAAASLAAAEEGLRHVSQSEAMAMVVTRIEPEFPAMARQLKITGEVEVDVVIADNGTVESVKPVSGNPVLTRSATDAVKRWKFKPFQHDGAAAKVETTLKISFAK